MTVLFLKITARKPTSMLLALLMSLTVILFQRDCVRADDSRIKLDFKDRTFSAMIRNAPLRDVISAIKQEEGIWFKSALKSSDEVLDRDVSIQFRNLSVEEGLGRIFSSLNHSFFLDNQNNVLGVYLLGQSDKKKRRGRRRTLRRRRPRRTLKKQRGARNKRRRRPRHIHLPPR